MEGKVRSPKLCKREWSTFFSPLFLQFYYVQSITHTNLTYEILQYSSYSDNNNWSKQKQFLYKSSTPSVPFLSFPSETCVFAHTPHAASLSCARVGGGHSRFSRDLFVPSRRKAVAPAYYE